MFVLEETYPVRNTVLVTKGLKGSWSNLPYIRIYPINGYPMNGFTATQLP